MTITTIYQTFAIAFLPAAIYMRLWRNSVSVFLFVVASAWCAAADMGGASDTVKFAGPLLIELAAIIRAILKPGLDRWVPRWGRDNVAA